MLRVFLTIVLPLLFPTVLYLLWVTALGSQEGRALSWAAIPWIWLICAGTILLTIVLFIVTVRFGSPEEGVYVPPRWKGGQIVPGHIEPRPVEPKPGR
jgi:hypothetical protein